LAPTLGVEVVTIMTTMNNIENNISVDSVVILKLVLVKTDVALSHKGWVI